MIGTIYRHRKGNVNEFTKKPESSIIKTTSDSKIKYCIITGDINIDIIKFENRTAVEDYLNTMLRNAFMPTIILPTRVTSHTCTLIGHIFYYSKTHRNNILNGNLLLDMTNHFANFLTMEPKKKNIMRNHMLGCSVTKIKTNLKIRCSLLTGKKNFAIKTQFMSCFYEQVTQTYNKLFPLTKLSNKKGMINHG